MHILGPKKKGFMFATSFNLKLPQMEKNLKRMDLELKKMSIDVFLSIESN